MQLCIDSAIMVSYEFYYCVCLCTVVAALHVGGQEAGFYLLGGGGGGGGRFPPNTPAFPPKFCELNLSAKSALMP